MICNTSFPRVTTLSRYSPVSRLLNHFQDPKRKLLVPYRCFYCEAIEYVASARAYRVHSSVSVLQEKFELIACETRESTNCNLLKAKRSFRISSKQLLLTWNVRNINFICSAHIFFGKLLVIVPATKINFTSLLILADLDFYRFFRFWSWKLQRILWDILRNATISESVA